MSNNEVQYNEDELLDFPDVDEVRNETTPKETIYLNKKRTFLASLAGDMLTKARSQGVTEHSAILAENFLGLSANDQEKMIGEIITIVERNGFKMTVTKNENGSRLVKVDWSKQDAN